jgi:hypothetical protein
MVDADTDGSAEEIPVGEIDAEESADLVSEDMGLESYIGKDIDQVLAEDDYEVPEETIDAEWVEPDELYPNEWNPNFMPDHRRDILVLSILDNGWTAPIIAQPDGKITDGEHRWTLAKDPRIQAEEDLTPDDKPAGLVPVFYADQNEKAAMLATYQNNYARGSDSAQELGKLIDGMEDDSESFVASRMGVTESELDLLKPDDSVLVDDTTKLWDVPWDEDTTEGNYTERLSFDMLETEAQLLYHLFGDHGAARGLIKLARFVVEAELYEEVDNVPEPDLSLDWKAPDEVDNE